MTKQKAFHQEAKGFIFRVATLVETGRLVARCLFPLIKVRAIFIPIPFPRSRRETPSEPT